MTARQAETGRQDRYKSFDKQLQTNNLRQTTLDKKLDSCLILPRYINFIGRAERTDAPAARVMAQKWGAAFLECGKPVEVGGGGMRGFQDKNITPYIHSLQTHAPEEVEEIGPLEDFNGEALEKANDEFKKNHLRQTNCKDIIITLQVTKRQELAGATQKLMTWNEKLAEEPMRADK